MLKASAFMNLRKIVLLSVCLLGTLSLSTTRAQAQESFKVPGHLFLDFGFNFLQGNPSQIDVLPLRSPSWGGSYLYPFQINDNSPITFNVGLGISQNMYSFANNVMPLYDTASGNPTNELYFDTVSQVISSAAVQVSQMGVIYANLPIEVRWDLKPGQDNNSLWVSLGGSIGYRIGSFSKVRYRANVPVGEDKVLTRRESFGLNDLRYGAQLRIGYDWINAYGRYEVSPLFSPLLETPAGGSWQVGVSIDLF